MPWSAAFYFGGSAGQTVFVPVETTEFEVLDIAAFEARQDAPVFELTVDIPVFDFLGKPAFEPIDDGAQFDVKC